MESKLYYVEYVIYDCSEWRHTNASDYILATSEQAAKELVESWSSMANGDYHVERIREATYEEYKEYQKRAE